MTLLDSRSKRGLDEVTSGPDGQEAEPDSPRAPGGKPQHLRAVLKAVLTLAAFLIALAGVAGAAALLTFPQARTAAQHVIPKSGLVPTIAAIAAVAALAALVAAWHAARRLVRNNRPASLLTVAAAADASVSAATGMWVFFGNILHFTVVTRVPIFSFLEIATIAFALRARDNLLDSAARARNGEEVSPSRGLDGMLMWVCTATSAVLSSMASVSVPEVAFRLATPLIAAVLWESGLSAEYQRKSGGRGKTIHWRFTLERVLVWAGFAEPTARDVSKLAADRRITQAAVAIVRARRARTAGWRAYTMHRARVRMRLAEQHVGLADDEERQALLLQKIAILDTTHELVSMRVRDPWQQAAPWGRGNDDQKDQKDKRRPDRPGGGGGGSPAARENAQLAEELSAVLRAAFDGNEEAARRVHALLARRDDYPALCRWIARNVQRGAKRMMAAVAVYAAADVTAPGRVAARDWVARQVPGQAGEVDRNEIRLIAQALEPVWEAEGYPGQPEAIASPQPTGGGAVS